MRRWLCATLTRDAASQHPWWRRWPGAIFQLPPQLIRIPARPDNANPRLPQKTPFTRRPFQVALCGLTAGALLSITPPADAAQLNTRFGPIHYQGSEQIMAYGRELNPAQIGGLNVAAPLPEAIVARHEYLFEQVCERLGVDCHELQATTVRIVPTLEELRANYRRLAPESTAPVTAFYSHRDRTIWYARESLSRDTALHEVAHSVLDHAFPQPLPTAVDELLARRIQQLY